MPQIGGSQSHSIQLLDYSGERKAITVPVQEITALTIVAFLLDAQAFNEAIDAVTLGTMARTSTAFSDVISNDRPASKAAQVETELLVQLRDAVTEYPFSFRIPTVDYTVFNYADPPSGDSVIISGAGASAQTNALVAAIVGLVRNPINDQNGVEVVSMRVVR